MKSFVVSSVRFSSLSKARGGVADHDLWHVYDSKEPRLSEVAPATANRELEILRRLFNFAEILNNFFGKNPISQAGLLPLNNQVERILTPEEEQRLLASSSPHREPF